MVLMQQERITQMLAGPEKSTRQAQLSRLVPAHRAEAHWAEVCAKFPYTQPETFPARSDSPAQQRVKEE